MKLFPILLTLLISTNVYADRKGSPFHPHDDKRFDEIEDQLEDTTEAAGLAQKQARFVYDVAVDGGSSTANKALGVTIPAGSILTKVMLYINTAFVDGGTASVALQCGGTRNILGYFDADAHAAPALLIGAYEDSQTSIIDHAGQVMLPGDAPSVLTSFPSVSTACEVTAVVRGDSGYTPYSAGKLVGVIEYFSKD